MPLYEYQCHDCGGTFEKMVRFSEAVLSPECPSCKGENTSKKISLFASRSSGPTSGQNTAASSCSSQGRFT